MISDKNELKVLKVFLLSFLHRLLCELLQSGIGSCQNYDAREGYEMDGKIIQFLIQGIVDSEEYTLEGIAYHTGIPFDVLYDALCGISNHLSIIPWVKIAALYLQVKPDIAKLMISKLIEISNDKDINYISILNLV